MGRSSVANLNNREVAVVKQGEKAIIKKFRAILKQHSVWLCLKNISSKCSCGCMSITLLTCLVCVTSCVMPLSVMPGCPVLCCYNQLESPFLTPLLCQDYYFPYILCLLGSDHVFTLKLRGSWTSSIKMH